MTSHRYVARAKRVATKGDAAIGKAAAAPHVMNMHVCTAWTTMESQ